MDGKTKTAVAVLTFVTFSTGVLVGLLGPEKTSKQTTTITLSCPIGYVCFKPENVECYIWDMTIGGYIPLTREKRQYVSSLVKKKHAKIKRLEDAIDCYHMAADDKLGDKVVTLTASWWKWEKR